MKPARNFDLLEPAVAMSAGLHARFGRNHIARQFDVLSAQAEKTCDVHRRLLSKKDTLKFPCRTNVAELLKNIKSERVIFAGSQFGPPLLSVAGLTSIGMKVAGVYWGLSETNKQILEKCDVQAINITEQTNRLSLIRLLHKLHSADRVIWLMCDAPGKSRSRYDFLGYSVRCANLIEVYARIYDCIVIPTYCRLISDAEASLHFDTPLINRQDITQRLLSNLETLIYEDPFNYIWNKACIIFSDPNAMRNGVRCLPDFLEWRDETAKAGRN